jgi:ATP-dependent DNA helicase PIF1
LSRLTSLEGLYLTRPLRPNDIIVDPNVRRFMQGGAAE